MTARAVTNTIVVAVWMVLATPGDAWQVSLPSGHSYGRVTALRTDADGNLLAVGYGGASAATLKLDTSSGEVLWRNRVGGVGLGLDLDSAGNAVTAGYGDGPGQTSEFSTWKYAGSNGEQLWRHDINGPEGSVGYAVTVDSLDDAVVVGAIEEDEVYQITVAKLAGASGEELWRQTIEGTETNVYGQMRSITTDSANDVVLGGGVTNATWGIDFTVVKLAAATGQELWRYTRNGTANANDRALQALIDANDDVIACGMTHNTGTAGDFTVVKLDGTFGFVLWEREISAGNVNDEIAFQVAADSAGDIYAVGRLGGLTHSFEVVKLSGSDGTILWQSPIGTDPEANQGPGITVDPAGNVLVVAGIGADVFDIVVTKLAGFSGAQLWRRSFNGRAGAQSIDEGGVILVDDDANVFAGATMNNSIVPTYDFTIFKLDGSDGEDLVAGRGLKIHDESTVERRSLTFLANIGVGISPGGAADPTLNGATLEIYNPLSGEAAAFPLPAGNWVGKGNPPGQRGYRYRDRDQPPGPCRAVSLAAGRIKAICRGSEIISLDEASQGSLAVRLTTGVGGDARQYCAEFGGTVEVDATGGFIASDASAPVNCPVP